MACRLVGAKPLFKPMQPYRQLDPKENISVNFYSKFKSFVQGNALESVIYEMAAILSWLQFLNPHCAELIEILKF